MQSAPGSKIKVIPINLEREKSTSTNFRKGLQKNHKSKKRLSKKFWGMKQKSRWTVDTLATPLCLCLLSVKLFRDLFSISKGSR